ncbi:hypothetical protein QYF36_007131 [Acer negundo]|nr:hypothetical protein QYF36_007131 [Acer negundo]
MNRNLNLLLWRRKHVKQTIKRMEIFKFFLHFLAPTMEVSFIKCTLVRSPQSSWPEEDGSRLAPCLVR